MRQHLVYQAGPLGWQARQNIFEVSVRVMPIKTSTLNQAHHRRTALTDSQRTREQPVVSKRAVRAFFADDLTDLEADEAFVPYLRAYESSWKLLPGVSEFLARTEHIPKVILTNGDRQQQRKKVMNTGLLGHVVSVVTPEDCGGWKPKPDMFIAGAKILGVPPSTCVVIGDDIIRDIESARAFGMRCFHADPGIGRRVFDNILSEISPA